MEDNSFALKYNEEVVRLSGFKRKLESQLRAEAAKRSVVENERNDLLYQGLDDEQRSTVLQQRLNDVVDELKGLAEITSEQDLALEFLVKTKIPKMENFIRENCGESGESFLREVIQSSEKDPILSRAEGGDSNEEDSPRSSSDNGST